MDATAAVGPRDRCGGGGPGGSVVGYGDLGDQAKDGSVLWLDVRGEASAEVHAELERRALERRSPDGVVRAVTDESDDGLRAILEERGYELIRSSYRMGIEVDGATFSPLWPDGAVCGRQSRGWTSPCCTSSTSARSRTTGAIHRCRTRSGSTCSAAWEWAIPRSGSSPRSTEPRPASRSAGRSTTATRIAAGSRCSASSASTAGAASGRHCCPRARASSSGAGGSGSVSGSTPRTRPARSRLYERAGMRVVWRWRHLGDAA